MKRKLAKSNTVPEGYVPTNVAYRHLGAPSVEALMLRFRRGHYPERFAKRVSPDRWGVNVKGLLEFLEGDPFGPFLKHSEAFASGPSLRALPQKGEVRR